MTHCPRGKAGDDTPFFGVAVLLGGFDVVDTSYRGCLSKLIWVCEMSGMVTWYVVGEVCAKTTVT
jgi:hypothetical protein